MSIRVMSFVWQAFPAGGSLLLLELALADYASDDGERIYPSVATLASKVHLSERSIQYLLRKLEKMGWLEVASRGGGRSRTCRYRIPVVKLQRLHPLADQPRKPRPVTAQRNGQKGAVAVAPDSSVNHQSTSPSGKTATAGSKRSHQTPSDPKHVAEHLARLKATLTPDRKKSRK